ncbi:baseplate J/gp47 family protein, partial [Mesorhizobium sp. 1M-11]|uniref:baseplate J/gp47 family protein n=1 Tax=Mesorhizobium sp. 1M-11 TaxID=1529006 RepID=UPI00191097F0
MPWPVPTARTIAERFASALETLVLAIRPEVDPVALSRAVRSARGMFSIIGRVVAMEAREIHDHVAWWSRQYFPDSAEDEFALRHASIWGVEHRGATTAVGTVTIEGVAGTVVPAGTELASSEAVAFTTDAVATIGGGTVDVAVTASVAGPTGNLEAGIRLVTVAPFPAISRITVAGAGIAGGAAEETAG